MKNNILITGHKGFIGSYVMELFPDAIGYDIKEYIVDDILNMHHLTDTLRKNRINTIIHLAAKVSIPEGEEKQVSYITNNVIGTMNVIQAAIKVGVKKIVYASSSASYEPYSSVYAFTKYTPELLLEHYKDKIQTVALRFFNVYGLGSNPAYARVIDEFIKGIKKGEINIYGDGEQTRDFIHVSDVAWGIKAIVENDVTSGSVFDLGTGSSISVNQLAKIIQELLNKLDIKINYLPARKEVKHSKARYALSTQVPVLKTLLPLRKGLLQLL